MKHLQIARLGLVLALATLILIVSPGIAVAEGDLASAIGAITEDRPAQGQSQEHVQAGDYDLSWWTGDYTLAGGFWGGAVVEYHIYLPLVLKG